MPEITPKHQRNPANFLAGPLAALYRGYDISCSVSLQCIGLVIGESEWCLSFLRDANQDRRAEQVDQCLRDHVAECWFA
jgi:hypothetical protein